MLWLQESCSSVSLQNMLFFIGDICKTVVLEKTVSRF